MEEELDKTACQELGVLHAIQKIYYLLLLFP
jgi:hypothetical protein